MRAFVALFLPPPIRAALDAAVRPLRARTRGLRWVDPAKLHVTLAFLGEIEDARAPEFVQVLQQFAGHAAPRLHLDRFGVFPPRGRPRVLWVGLAGEVGLLVRFAQDVAQALAPLGYEPEQRAFTPHVTLARARDRGPSPELADALRGCELRPTEFRLGKLGLYRSEVEPQGARYLPITELDLGT